MKTYLMGLALTYIVGQIQGFLTAWWMKRAPAIQPAVQAAETAIETRLGHTAPGWVHNIISVLVTQGVAVGNKIFQNGAMIRDMLRGLAKGDPSKLAAIETQIVNVDWSTNVMNQIPAEYKDAINTAVSLVVNKSVAAKIEQAVPAENVPAPTVLHSMVEKAVVAAKIEQAPKLVATASIAEMIAATKAKLQAEIDKK